MIAYEGYDGKVILYDKRVYFNRLELLAKDAI